MASATPAAWLFPPLDKSWALGKGSYSANVLQKLCKYSQMLRSFPQAREVLLDSLPVNPTLWQVWEEAERVGADLVRRRENEIQEMMHGRAPEGPPNPPDLLVISADGARLQDRERPPGERWCEYKAAVLYRATREEDARDGERPDPQPRPHWKYTTVLGKRQKPGEKTCRDPEPEVKTFTATTRKIDRFPLIVELEARRRGLMRAKELAFIGDGGDFVWTASREVTKMRRKAGKRVTEILDLTHANSHLVEAAKAAWGADTDGSGVEWLNSRLEELWAGKAEKLIAELEKKAEELGPRPERKKRCAAPLGPEDLGVRGKPIGEDEHLSPVVVLWRCRDYFAKNRERIRYDEFRRKGLPLYSTHVESGVKQTNERVKGANKSWLLEHAEEMLALRCQALSEDARWKKYWDAVRAGEIEIPTRGRMKPIPVQGLEAVPAEAAAGG
jgi:hypothetical protein